MRAGLLSADRFAPYLKANRIPWPSWKAASSTCPTTLSESWRRRILNYRPCGSCASALSELRLERSAVGHDGRNRCDLNRVPRAFSPQRAVQ